MALAIGVRNEFIMNPLTYADMKLVQKRFSMNKSNMLVNLTKKKGDVEE